MTVDQVDQCAIDFPPDFTCPSTKSGPGLTREKITISKPPIRRTQRNTRHHFSRQSPSVLAPSVADISKEFDSCRPTPSGVSDWWYLAFPNSRRTESVLSKSETSAR